MPIIVHQTSVQNVKKNFSSQIMRFRFLQTPSSLSSFRQKIFLAFSFEFVFAHVFFFSQNAKKNRTFNIRIPFDLP